MYNISVVMAVYAGTRVDDYNLSLLSVIGQSYLPKEVVVVYDGEGCEQHSRVTKLHANLNSLIEFSELFLPNNVGPGLARNYGVRVAKCELISIMDSDDLSCFNRFELQISAFKRGDFDLVGGQIEEYDDDLDRFLQMRSTPVDTVSIKKDLRYRSSINNVTVMIKRDVFLKLGGYANIRFGEDYVLWALFFDNKYVAINLPDTLVKVRTGKSFMLRRYGFRNFINNLRLASFLSKTEAVGCFYALLRLIKFSLFMILPEWLKIVVFRRCIRY